MCVVYAFFYIFVPMGRIISIDYGRKRTGLAASDTLQMIANGLTTLPSGEVVNFLSEYVKKEPEIPVEYYDERFTSVLAHKAMLEGGLKKKKRQDKALVDEISAVIILQEYLESKKFKF